jgi:hypothetical protein
MRVQNLERDDQGAAGTRRTAVCRRAD